MITPSKTTATPTKRSLPAKSSVQAQLEPEPLTVPFSQGDVIGDKYEVVGLLGAGGVAYVISALHLELGEMVALKFLRPESLAHEDVVARFASEARAVARIKSEHVAHVYDVGTLPDGAPYIVMEYLEGRDLADVLAERGSVPCKVAVDYVLQACEALACAHALDIVHRDIKPENLFLTGQAASVDVIKVLDFGISKSALGAPEAGGRRSARTMLPMGTPGYMSPEQIRACGSVDARTDIWALGCVLSELITGRSAFDAPTQVQLGAAILERDPIPLREFLPEAPAELEALILRCLAKDPNDRFQDVAELAVALYPFGPRRGRVSAERCHQVLKGKQGVVIEFNSVPPPSFQGASTPLPVSSTGAVVSAAPGSLPRPDGLRTSTPASLDTVEWPQPKRRGRSALVALVVLGSAAAGVALALRTAHYPSSPGPTAASSLTAALVERAAAASAPTALPTTTAKPSALPAAGGSEPIMLAPAAVTAATPVTAPAATAVTPATPAATDTSPSALAQRAKVTRAQRAAAAVAARREAAAKAKPAAPVKRASGPDDSEPDVGY